MFEVGKAYVFTMVDVQGGTSEQGGTVEAYEHPLVKLADVDVSKGPFAPPGPGPKIIQGPIINVTSLHFVKAVLRKSLPVVNKAPHVSSLSVEFQSDGSTVYVSEQGDMVDKVAWQHYGTERGTTEAILDANPGLADHGPILPAGVKIILPKISVP